MRSIAFLSLTLLACEPGASARASQLATADTASPPSSTVQDTNAAPRGASARAVSPDDEIPIVRGLYILRWATQSPARMKRLIEIADSTEINALVIDIKDEFGLNYVSRHADVNRNAGDPEKGKIRDVRALTDSLRAHRILPIARIVVFKDPWAAKANPDHVIRKPDGGIWIDKAGNVWVNPYDRYIWDYNLKVAEEAVALGFGEIQFDYIRFPEPYPSLPKQVFPTANGRTKPQALAEFLKIACPRVRALGARCTVDVFGLTTTVVGALEIGQQWETMSPLVDVMLPMTYPSHYPRGAFNIARPNAEPYKVQYTAIKRARERDEKLGIENTGHVRAWLQAFSLPRMLPKYGPAEIEAQKQAIYDAGYESWILWSPGSRYESFLPAFEKTTESRRTRADTPSRAQPDSAAPAVP